jgi:hypothetical protein
VEDACIIDAIEFDMSSDAENFRIGTSTTTTFTVFDAETDGILEPSENDTVFDSTMPDNTTIIEEIG